MRRIGHIGLTAALGLLSACGGGDPALPNVVALSPDGVRHQAFSYSPDGKRMAYWAPPTDSTTNWQLWIAGSDLSAPAKLPVATAFANFPAVWSPDGSRLAVSSSAYGIADVVTVPTAGGEASRLTRGPGAELPSRWHRNADQLTYIATAAGGTFKSFTIALSTGVSVPLVPGENRPNVGVPSPDGSHVAYLVFDGSKTTIWVADSAGGNPRQLTTEGFELLGQFNDWSPDGKELLYESRRTGTSDLWVVSIDGGKARQLTRDVRNDFGGAWSPDGKSVAFISDRGKQTDIWVVPAAGGVEQRVTDSPIEEQEPLFWRPASNTLAFGATTERSGVWALEIASGKERRLTPDSLRTGFFNVSPNGKQVVYRIERGGGIRDLAVVSLEGGASRLLVAGGGTVGSPWWSPDGSKIVFSSDRGGSYDVWIVDAAGGAPRQLVNWPGFEFSPVWNADGSAIFFTSDRDSKLGDIWKVPAAGGEPMRLTRDGTAQELYSRTGVADIFVGVLNARGGEIGLSRMRPDGSLQAVGNPSVPGSPSISPSGDSVAVVAEQADGKQRSMILPANGGRGRVILKADEIVGAWSNDGKWLLYTMSVGGATDIGIMNVADGTTRRLTTTAENELGGEFTPDGKSVVFRRVQTVQRINAVDLTKLLAAPR